MPLATTSGSALGSLTVCTTQSTTAVSLRAAMASKISNRCRVRSLPRTVSTRARYELKAASSPICAATHAARAAVARFWLPASRVRVCVWTGSPRATSSASSSTRDFGSRSSKRSSSLIPPESISSISRALTITRRVAIGESSCAISRGSICPDSLISAKPRIAWTRSGGSPCCASCWKNDRRLVSRSWRREDSSNRWRPSPRGATALRNWRIDTSTARSPGAEASSTQSVGTRTNSNRRGNRRMSAVYPLPASAGLLRLARGAQDLVPKLIHQFVEGQRFPILGKVDCVLLAELLDDPLDGGMEC